MSKTKIYPKASEDSRRSESGFTLVELLAIAAIVGIWAALLLPALARTRPTSEAAQCMNNLKQVMVATSMYTQDYQELFPPNPDDGTLAPYNWCSGNAGIYAGQEFNPDILADPSRMLLAPYLRSNVSVFHCTADWRVGTYQGRDPSKIGQMVPSARSISMSQAVGTVDPQFAVSGSGHSGKPTVPTNGPWLTGSHTVGHGPWRTYGKTSDIVAPTPAGLFVFIEENPWSINDGGLSVSAGLPVWIDYPSTQHNLGGVVAFADNHVELHRWVTTALRVSGPLSQRTVSSTDPDWNWLAKRTSVLAH